MKTLKATDILSWPQKSDRYAPGFFIGSEGEDGEHIADTTGWPYSIYRKSTAIGVYDQVICGGIQGFGDACAIANLLQSNFGEQEQEPDNPEDRGPWRYLKSPVLTPDEIQREWARFEYARLPTEDEALAVVEDLYASGEIDHTDEPLIERIEISRLTPFEPRYRYAITLRGS